MTEEIQRLMRIAFLNEPTCHRYIVTVDDPARPASQNPVDFVVRASHIRLRNVLLV